MSTEHRAPTPPTSRFLQPLPRRLAASGALATLCLAIGAFLVLRDVSVGVYVLAPSWPVLSLIPHRVLATMNERTLAWLGIASAWLGWGVLFFGVFSAASRRSKPHPSPAAL